MMLPLIYYITMVYASWHQISVIVRVVASYANF